MTKIEKIQQEFEDLIKELNRLKNINELISNNTENSKNVIHEMDSFVKISDDYRKKVDEDFSKKSEVINKLIKRIDVSIDKFQMRKRGLYMISKIMDEFYIEGIKTTIPFHRQLMDEPDYVAGNYTTKFMESFKMNDPE